MFVMIENAICPCSTSKPPQFPSVGEWLILWQQPRVFWTGEGISRGSFAATVSGEALQIEIRHLRHDVCTPSNSLLARLALPDSDGVALDCVLAAECADVSGVLCDFHLLHLLPQRSTVSV